MRNLIKAQFIILLLGTVFAWANFGVELYSWLNNINCPTGCTVELINPFFTPCFYGAIFFLLAFILSILIMKKSK